MAEKETVHLSFEIDKDIHEAIKADAKKEGRSISAHIRIILSKMFTKKTKEK